MKLWIDDIRKPPEGFAWVKSVKNVKRIIDRCFDSIDVIDIDHDAGKYFPYGGDYIEVLNYLELYCYENNRKFSGKIHVHSMNPIGRIQMNQIIKRNGW